MARLEYWSVHLCGNGYQAPEIVPHTLAGEVYDHHRCRNGQRVQTSAIVDFDKEKRTVNTESGTVYHLGKPDPLWLKWLEENGHPHGEDIFPFWLD